MWKIVTGVETKCIFVCCNTQKLATYLKDFASLEKACVFLIFESKEEVEGDFAALVLLKHEAVPAARGARR